MSTQTEALPQLNLQTPSSRDRFYADVSNPENVAAHAVEVFTSDDTDIGDEVKAAAQALHTRVYLSEGFITETDLSNGVYEDDYSARSTYYFAKNGTKDVVARQIEPKDKDILSLPTFKTFSCDPEKIKEVADIQNFGELKANQVVEISALSSEKKNGDNAAKAALEDKLHAVPFLYASMLKDSIEKGHKLWISNMEEPLINVIGAMVGPDQLHKVGESKAYMGDPTTPVAINPLSIVESVLESDKEYMDVYKDYIRTVFKDVNVDKVPKEFAKMLRANGVETTRSSFAKRLVRSKEFIAQLAIFSYSVARVAPAAMVDEFEGSTAALLAIDVGTAVPYTHGVIKMYTGKTTKDKLLGAALAVPSFLAPYAYYYAEGKDYPTEVNAIAGTLVVGAIASEVLKRRKNKKTDAEISQSLSSYKD